MNYHLPSLLATLAVTIIAFGKTIPNCAKVDLVLGFQL
jgi:hypothetical protein